MVPKRGALPLQEGGPEYPIDELVLVERAKKQDPAAAEELVRRYHEKAYALAYRTCLGDAEEARDLTQEAFLRAFRNLHQFKGKASFYTWLYRIVVNTCLDGLRRQKRRKTVFSALKSEEYDAAIESAGGSAAAPEDANPASILSGTELKRQVQKALNGLSGAQRLVFELKVFEEMSIPEIARVTGSAEGTVKSHLFRATQHIRKALQDWGKE